MQRVIVVAALFCLMSFGQEGPSKYELPAGNRTGTIKRIFVVCHSHLDIGFTRPPDEVARDYKDNIDAAIRLTRENKDFRWTIESAWMLEEWLRRTDDEALITELGQMLHGHVDAVTVTVMPADGVSRLPLSSAARLRIVSEPGSVGVKV